MNVFHQVDFGGQTKTTIKNIDFSAQSIYVGEEGVITDLNTAVSSINGALLFPGFVLSNRNLSVDGVLNVNKQYNLSNADVCMNPKAGIDVFYDIHFGLFNNTHIHHKLMCENWRSIQLLGSTSVLNSFGSTIEGALYGIQMAKLGGLLRLSDTHFLNNFIGIFSTGSFALPLFSDNTFESVGMLPPDAGIPPHPVIPVIYAQGEGFSGIFTSNSTFNMPTFGITNVFQNMGNGIYMINSNPIIRRSQFLNMDADVYGLANAGNGINFIDESGGHAFRQFGLGQNAPEISFENCGIGINALSENESTFFQSQNNRMNVTKGYQLISAGAFAPNNNNENSEIFDNDITANDIGVLCWFSNPIENQCDIRDNTITANNAQNVTGSNTVGIALLGGFTSVVHDVDIFDNPAINVEIGGFGGIFSSFFSGAWVSNNTINLDSDVEAIGIDITAGVNHEIECNTISGQWPGSAVLSEGIEASSSVDIHYEDNRLSDMLRGFAVFGDNGTQTEINCNSFQNHEVYIMMSSVKPVTR